MEDDISVEGAIANMYYWKSKASSLMAEREGKLKDVQFQ